MAKREMKSQNVEETNVESVETTETVKTEEVVEPIAKEKKASGVSKGIVVDCEKLNVRKAAKNSDIVTVIDKGSKVTIDDDKSTDEWYRVKTEKNIWGFCMKKYIKIK